MLMKKILDGVNSSADLKKLNIAELEILAEEIREILIGTVSKNGGHLSSNLGAVELTLAMHKVFDFSSDKIVWDVGHQSYTHKIITGRKEKFSSLRQKGGISGFPKTEESETDAFNTGHSSTSVSAALGFATAFAMEKSNARAVAVIGDGALTGGMAYEALNHAGSSRLPLIVILNDNGMSISENVGGLSQYLRRMTSKSKYINAKVSANSFLKGLPVVGEPFRRFVHSSKRFVKKLLLQKKLFENMGLEYLGPVDGHDLEELITIMNYAKSLGRPVIVHAVTRKGKGYAPSESDPAKFHGIGKFDQKTGESAVSSKETYSGVFGSEITKLAKNNEKVVCITAAMPDGTGLTEFSKEFPDRFFDVGIAEGHAVTFSAALAKSGLVPVFAVYSTFLQRGYDQLIHDVAFQNLHTVFAIDRAGATGNDGETHQGIYDFSYLSHIPNMKILAPSSGAELRAMLKFAVSECDGPVAIRYPRGGAGIDQKLTGEIKDGCGVLERVGSDVLIVALGSEVGEAMTASEILAEKGISVAVMNARFLKPFDEELLQELSDGKRLIVTCEDNVGIGGLADTVRRILGTEILGLSFSDEPLKCASIEEQKKDASLDGSGIAERIMRVFSEGDEIE